MEQCPPPLPSSLPFAAGLFGELSKPLHTPRRGNINWDWASLLWQPREVGGTDGGSLPLPPEYSHSKHPLLLAGMGPLPSIMYNLPPSKSRLQPLPQSCSASCPHCTPWTYCSLHSFHPYVTILIRKYFPSWKRTGRAHGILLTMIIYNQLWDCETCESSPYLSEGVCMSFTGERGPTPTTVHAPILKK